MDGTDKDIIKIVMLTLFVGLLLTGALCTIQLGIRMAACKSIGHPNPFACAVLYNGANDVNVNVNR